MDNALEFVKKYKKRIIIISVILIIFIAIFIAVKKVVNYLTPSTKQSVYGDRCDAVKDYPVTKDIKSEIKKSLKAYEAVEFKNIDVKCRLIDITINLKEDITDETLYELGYNLIASMPEDIVKLYDIELFVTSSNKEDETYPRIGTHHKVINGEANDNFVW